MRAALIVAWLATAATAHAQAPSPAAYGFDHNIHDRDIVVTGKPSLPCERCHAIKLGLVAGKPDHAACFGACHGPAPVTPPRGLPLVIDTNRMKLCTTCHSEASLRAAAPANAPFGARQLRVAYPPYKLGQEFALVVGHKRHEAIACAQCHPTTLTDNRRPVPHKRCAGCHDGTGGKGPAMSACKGCHTAGAGSPDPPAMLRTADTQILVTGAFSHARHGARGAAGRQCTTCHAGITSTDDNQLPRVVAKSCAAAACHDGRAAFPITSSCTKCHPTAPTDRFRVARPAARFSHTAHVLHLNNKLDCAACHALSRTGEAISRGHAPCAGCHADDFGARDPKTCGACHTATEPWRALVADQLPPDRSEFGATLDHAKHPGDCSGCHALTTSRAQLRPPRGHRACTGKGCHAVTGGPAPLLSACDGCHQRGLADPRSAARLAAAWSVRARFDHATHELDSAGPIACTSCHVDLASPHVLGLATPPKATCARCHDGKVSFKLTGTACTRCHVGAKR
jgi:predicted CXXCH cytochrome family protein